MREGIATVVGLDDQLDVVATSGSYAELVAAVDEHRPDVVITDIRMPPSQTDEGIRAARATSSALERLTEREREVLEQMATGASNGAIGEALFISARSVEKHINSIFVKFDLAQNADTHRRVRAVLVYLTEGSTDS